MMLEQSDATLAVAGQEWKPEQVGRWWGPNGHTLLYYEVDLLQGGASRVRIRSPEGHDYCVEGISLEIVEPERIVFSGSLGMDGLHETAGTVTFRRTERTEQR